MATVFLPRRFNHNPVFLFRCLSNQVAVDRRQLSKNCANSNPRNCCTCFVSWRHRTVRPSTRHHQHPQCTFELVNTLVGCSTSQSAALLAPPYPCLLAGLNDSNNTCVLRPTQSTKERRKDPRPHHKPTKHQRTQQTTTTPAATTTTTTTTPPPPTTTTTTGWEHTNDEERRKDERTNGRDDGNERKLLKFWKF